MLRVHPHPDPCIESLDRVLIGQGEKPASEEVGERLIAAAGEAGERRQGWRAEQLRGGELASPEVRLLQRATREGPGLHATIGIVEELLQRAPEHGVLHAQVHQPVSWQSGEEAVEAESGDDQVDMAGRLTRGDEEVRDILAADWLLQVPDHPGEQAR